MAYTTIDDPSAYFQTALYTGNGSSQSIINDGNSDLQPDWIWTKERSSSSTNQNHTITDSSRGNTKQLFANLTSSEGTSSAFVTSFNSDGFSLGDNPNINYNTATYVGWQWKANGGITSSNTDGDITSTVQVNTTAGFSIVSYTGNGTSSQTVGHGLGAVPDMLIVKNRTGSGWKWDVWHSSFGDTDLLRLDQTTARETSNGDFDALPTSSVFTVGTNGSTNENSASIIAYCFTEKKGYSKFGSYTGNGNADGPFIYTGFKPAWVMFKSTSATGAWQMYDSTRETFNDGTQPALKANGSDAEFTKNVDILSNGVKLRDTTSDANASGVTYVYIAFAEHPFVGSDGVPTTAR